MSFTPTTAPHPDDTIVAVSSAPGPAPRAIVRVGGPTARAVVAKVFEEEPNPPAPFPGREGGGFAIEEPDRQSARGKFGASAPPSLPGKGVGGLGSARHLIPGTLRLSGVHSPLPASVYFFAGPRSYTGQDIAEIHTIGSPPLVERLVADLLAAGARPARPGEFTMRAFLAGKKDLPQAEAVQAVIEAGTDADLRAALAQLAGGVSRPLDALRDDLLNLLADVEAALDFADEDIEFVGKDDVLRRVGAAVDQLDAVRAQLDDRAVSGRPVRVALVGLPNAGKSSLFNALTGGAALVSAIPGTTRDYLTAPLALAGVAAELIDTAGWEETGGGTGEPARGSPIDTSDTIEEQAQRLGREQAARADVIVWCDERGAFEGADEARLRATGAAVLKVRTKGDLAAVLTSPPEGEVAGPLWGRRVGGAAAEMREGAPPPSGSRSLADLPLRGGGEERSPLTCSVLSPNGLDALRAALGHTAVSLARPALAPSQSRCRHHVLAALERLHEARALVTAGDAPELLALALRGALDALGEMTGAVHTDDLLDRIFSRFCIGK